MPDTDPAASPSAVAPAPASPPAAPPAAPPDALLVPTGWRPADSPLRGFAALAAILGAPAHVSPGTPGPGWNFAVTKPGETYLFPGDHDLAGFPRYDWTVRADGLKFGTLKPEAK